MELRDSMHSAEYKELVPFNILMSWTFSTAGWINLTCVDLMVTPIEVLTRQGSHDFIFFCIQCSLNPTNSGCN